MLNVFNELIMHETLFTKIRLGKNGDGGYVVADEIFQMSPLLYSYGIADDVSFELDFMKMYPEGSVRLFDPSIEKLPEDHPGFSFVKEGLASTKAEGFDTVENHILKFNDIDIGKTLKIDIEWAEWDVFGRMSPKVLNQFDQIICEFHLAPLYFNDKEQSQYFTGYYKSIYDKLNRELFQYYADVLSYLNNAFTIIHMHANNSLKPLVEDGLVLPQLLEVTMVKSKLIREKRAYQGELPTSFDFPNKTDREDIKWTPFCEKR